MSKVKNSKKGREFIKNHGLKPLIKAISKHGKRGKVRTDNDKEYTYKIL